MDDIVISEATRKVFRRLGQKGGKARAEKLTAKRRLEISRLGVLARRRNQSAQRKSAA